MVSKKDDVNKNNEIEDIDKEDDFLRAKSKNAESWLNEHGQPNYKYLQDLTQEGSPESMEKLRLIADDLNVDYNSGTSQEELVEKIRLAIDQNQGDENFLVTS